MSTDGLVVGAFQFAASGDVDRNLAAIERGVGLAAEHGVRLLVLQECALSGYPPLEVDSIADVDRAALRRAERTIVGWAQANDLFIAYGSTEFDADGRGINTMRIARPSGQRSAPYVKRALYGWDADHFVAGDDEGPVVVIDGFRVAMRICWEVRFPEMFRELLDRRIDIALVPLCMLGADEPRRSVAEAHLVSRAVENCFHVVAANSCSRAQGCPTCVVDSAGRVLARAEWDVEDLAVATLPRIEPTFGQRGILGHARTYRS